MSTICYLRIACFLAACQALAPAAAAERLDDFTHAIPVYVSGKQAVVQLVVPRGVYLEARSAELRDLRLFDASGAPIPFALIDQMQEDQESRTTAPVTIFPVRGPAGNANLPDGLEIRPGEHGAVISVAPSRRGAGDALSSLVLDLQGRATASNPVAALALSLPPEVTSYNAQLALDISDDLQEWEEMAVASVSWLVNSQGASVRKHRIAFSPRAFRFARLRWIAGTPIEFAAVSAELTSRQSTVERWDSVVVRPAADGAGPDLVYRTPIALPAQSIGLDLHGQNVVMPVLVGQYRKQTDGRPGGDTAVRLQPVANVTFFRLTQNGSTRASGDIGIPLTHASQWVVRPQANAPERPGLRLRWKPAVMVFVAGGKAPYSLAFGAQGVRSSQVPLGQVAPGFSLRELATLEHAQTGEPVRQRRADEIAGAADREKDASRTRVLWLWGLLVAGVGVLALMAWKLLNQMKEGGVQQPPA